MADFVGTQRPHFVDICTWCPSVALDFKLIIRQLHSQTKVRDTDITCKNTHQSNVKKLFVIDMNNEQHTIMITGACV